MPQSKKSKHKYKQFILFQSDNARADALSDITGSFDTLDEIKTMLQLGAAKPVVNRKSFNSTIVVDRDTWEIVLDLC